MAKIAAAEQNQESHLARARFLQRPTLLFVITGAGIFAVEAGLMLVLAIFHEQLTVWQQALIDALLLILVLFPLLYLFYLLTFRPLRLHNAELLQFGRQLEEQIAERRESEAALLQSEKQLHLLSAQLLTVQEKERRHVSRELHEDLGQSLIALKLRLRLLQGAISQDQSASHHELRVASAQLDDMVRHVRRLSRDLSPAILEDLGFTTAARRVVSDYAGDFGLDTAVTVDDGVDSFFKGAAGIHTYRILEEALENVQKHAEATHVSVSVKDSKRELSLVVEDNGKGFDFNREEARGLGLATMYERARLLNSSLDLWSESGRGTKITLKIPRQCDSCSMSTA